jgi:arginyl-tRNA--protein-N-Asp/Glu arginylyltransferase
MKSEDYHMLINRGWRRCGTYYYKPHTQDCIFSNKAAKIIDLTLLDWMLPNSMQDIISRNI